MGKIVKYCVSCDEGFAEKFGFCPTCGAQLQSFEMKPVAAAAPAAPEPVEEVAPEPPLEAAAVEEETPIPAFSGPEPVIEEPVQDLGPVDTPLQAVETEEVITVPAAPSPGPDISYQPASAAFSETGFSDPDRVHYEKDDGYYITVIQEKNLAQRNMLLLGAAAFMVILAVGGTVYSLFHKDLQLAAIDGGDLYAFVPVVEDEPMTVEEEKKKKDDEGGGGGGGGREEKDPASEGRLANQSREKPFMNPDVSTPQKKSELQCPPATTIGDNTYPPDSRNYGVTNGQNYTLSNGQGSGGGQGSGTGTGQGSGRGTGNGSGDGSGSGSGEGNGNGNGRGDGSGSNPGAPPPPPTAGPPSPLKILSKPRANYTDAARQNNVQGMVTLKITFLANGQIGGISAVSGLPYGLTENAIAAARAIRFEPMKRGGVPQTVTKTLQYTFTIY